MTAQLSERVAAELARIHRPARYFCGFTPAGELHMMAGGSIGPDDMPMERGMKSYTRCATCRTPSGPARDCWPCETAALLVEAGVMRP